MPIEFKILDWQKPGVYSKDKLECRVHASTSMGRVDLPRKTHVNRHAAHADETGWTGRESLEHWTGCNLHVHVRGSSSEIHADTAGYV